MLINLLDCFEKVVNEKPDAIAIIEGDEKTNFLDLRKMAYVISTEIIRIVNDKNIPIAVYMPKSKWCIAADLGILYSANIYMNLDVNLPQSRIDNIIDNVEPELIISLKCFAGQLSRFENVIYIDDLSYIEQTEIRYDRLIDTDPMCIINTSGSTGTPKGVILNHRSFIDFTNWALETFDFSDEEVIGSLSPAVFDIYSFELCLLMIKGATIVIIPAVCSSFPASLMELLVAQQITFIFWVPTIMVNIANLGLLEQIKLVNLKKVWFAGEVFPTKQFNQWKRNVPGAQFTNLYGPIEITLDCTYYIVNHDISDDEPIPIGKPCRNTDVFLLKEDNSLAGEEEEGEICVRGTSLAMGYYNQEEKTRGVFCQNPLNKKYPETIYKTGDLGRWTIEKNLIFMGRKDTIVKHNGYRIELTEIEHIAVDTLQIVQNCCVLYDHSRKMIIMIYESEKEIREADLKIKMKNYLPKYMIPGKFIFTKSMPQNANGKIDRLKLQREYEIKYGQE